MLRPERKDTPSSALSTSFPDIWEVQIVYPDMIDYEQTRRDFRWEVPERYNFAFDVIDRWAEDPHKLAMLWVNERGDEPMMFYFTSGTVGYPKMVLHTHVSYPIGHIVTGKYWLDLKPTDTGWAKAAYSNLFGPWVMGAAMFTFDGRGRFDARQTLDLLERYLISWRPHFSSSHTADALPPAWAPQHPLRHWHGLRGITQVNRGVPEVWRK